MKKAPPEGTLKTTYRKSFAVVLSASLLVSQSGFFAPEALAVVIGTPKTAGTTVGAKGTAGNVGNTLSVPSLNGFKILPSGGNVGLTGVLPGAVQVEVNPSLAVQEADSLALPAGPVELAPENTPSIPGTPSAENNPVLDGGKSEILPTESREKTAALGGLGGLKRSITKAPGVVSGVLRKFYDGLKRTDSGIEAAEAGGESGQAISNGLRKAASEKNYEHGEPLAPEPGAPDSLKEISLEKPSDREYMPSPKDWADEVIYSVVMDRFAREAPYKTYGDPKLNNTRHGGNIRGVISKLDYLKELGVTAIHIPPVMMNTPAAYHGYHPIHFLAVDPHLGTMADFKKLVQEAHKRGLRVVLDMVFNHTGPVIEYEEGWQWGGMEGPPKTIKKWVYDLKPVELADAKHFHLRGSIQDWHDPAQTQYGDFPGGLNHFATERTETQDALIKIAKWWIKETDVDGYRLDTYQHVAPSFWKRFFAEVGEYAATLGKGDFYIQSQTESNLKDNFMFLGEIYNGDPNKVGGEVGRGKLSHAYNYPAYFWDIFALHAVGPTKSLEDSLRALVQAMGGRVRSMVRFLDNQDKPRFLRSNDPYSLLRLALAYTLFSIGVPLIYNGTEQAMRRPKGSDSLRVDVVGEEAAGESTLSLDDYREDMFPEGQFKSESSRGNMFNTRSESFQDLKKLLALRKENSALRRGAQYFRWSDANGPGLLAFSRIEGREEVLVVMNTANETRSAKMYVDVDITPEGAELVDLLDPAYKITVTAHPEGGSEASVEVPPHGVRVLTRKSK